MRTLAAMHYAATSWARVRRGVARIEVTRKGVDMRYVVTNPRGGSAQQLKNAVYCTGGGHAKNPPLGTSRTANPPPMTRCGIVLRPPSSAHFAASPFLSALGPFFAIVQPKGCRKVNAWPGSNRKRKIPVATTVPHRHFPTDSNPGRHRLTNSIAYRPRASGQSDAPALKRPEWIDHQGN